MRNHISLQVFLIIFLFSKMCECQNRSMDVKTPRNAYLSAFYKRSFAFYTVHTRMPVIITSLIDNLARRKGEISEEFGVVASEELKKVIGELSKFKYEVQTNKPLAPLRSNAADVPYYNDYIEKQATEEGHTTHFNTIWLLTECYMYRRIRECFELTDYLKEFDPFRKQKEESYTKALPIIKKMGKYLVDFENDNSVTTKETFISLLKLNLWGNKCDLSNKSGMKDGYDNIFDTAALEENILCNHSEDIWEAVSAQNSSSDIIDIVLDNSGYEVFTDLCLADYMISKNLAKKIRIYVKSIPWFISDVMEDDFYWHLDKLKKSEDGNLQKLGKRWDDYVKNDTFEIVVDDFWTMPFEFKFMAQIKPSLYEKLAEAKAVFFKGDLNYRKLFGEINWDPTTSVEKGLQGFHPSKLCILRTIKADIVCGLKAGVAEMIEKTDPKWLETGDYGLIQFCDKIVRID